MVTGTVRSEIIEAVWHGLDPFEAFPERREVDLQGWGADHPYLAQSVAEVRPRIVAEIGVWKGASVATLASKLKELEIDGVVIAIDTWLGSVEHWTTPHWFKDLAFEYGRPTLQMQFMANMLAKGLGQYVLPLPLDSLNAARVLSRNNLQVDLLHLDAGHDYASVAMDLRVWWPLIKPGGILVGDDYNTNGVWPEVRQAFDEFFGQLGLMPFNVAPPKCLIRKPAAVRTYDLVEPADLSDGSLRRVIVGAPASGSDETWCAAEGSMVSQRRWMATNSACWGIEVPGKPTILQVKIPISGEVRPGAAAGSSVVIGGKSVPTQVRESAIFARLPEPITGRVSVELHTSDSDTVALTEGTDGNRRGALAIAVMT